MDMRLREARLDSEISARGVEPRRATRGGRTRKKIFPVLPCVPPSTLKFQSLSPIFSEAAPSSPSQKKKVSCAAFGWHTFPDYC